MATISQREARALKRRVRELEAEVRGIRRAMGEPYAGVWIRAIDPAQYEVIASLRTAMRLGFTVVARFPDNDSTRLNFFAVPTEVKRNV